MRYRITIIFALLTCCMFGANLIHEFTFNGNLEDSIGSSTLEPVHVNSSFFNDGVWNWTSSATPGGGLLLPAYLPDNQCYTMQIQFKYNSLNYGWTKIVNFSDLQLNPWGYFSLDTGLYFNGTGLAFYNLMFYTDCIYEVNTWYDLTISRGTDSLISVFMAVLGQDPQLVMQFQDTTGIGIPTRLESAPGSPYYFGLFYDDNHNDSEWTTGGSVSLIRVWDDTTNPFVIESIDIDAQDGITHLSWSMVQGATLYRVYCSDTPNPELWTPLGLTENPSYIYPAVEPRKFFRVTADLP